MSEMINNRKHRQKILKELITELHNGKTVEEIKPRFEKLIEGVSPTEISEMEQALIMDGMPVEEIQNLCDVHASIFKGSIEEIHRPNRPEDAPGHPIHTFRLENKELEKLIEEKINPDLESFKNLDSKENIDKLAEDFKMLWEIDKHYARKENLVFPYMEKYGITAPPKVMWGVDDEIRNGIKEIRYTLDSYNGNKGKLIETIDETLNKLNEMIFKEENILFPMVLDSLSEDEWIKIEEESEEFGYCLTKPQAEWKPERVNTEKKVDVEESNIDGYVNFDAGSLTPEEINAMFNTLPIDITYVNKEGIVKYFSQGQERIFPRPKTVLGREVKNCHPPASVHVVEQIVEDLMSGKKDNEDFWIKMGDKYVHIRYFAVRNAKGEYLGTMEVTQNIKPIQEITGEKRLMSE